MVVLVINEESTKHKLNYIKEHISKRDPEQAHSKADDALCAFLYAIGYDEIVKLYKEI